MDQPTHHGVLSTTERLLSKTAFKGATWGLFMLCFFSLCGRIGVRLVCFRKLFVEDYLMIVVLGIMLANAVLCQIRVDLVYMIAAVGNDEMEPPPTFPEDVTKATHTALAGGLICFMGIWAVKYNFLLFFYRLGSSLRSYRIFWWVVVAITTACFAILLGITDYQCTNSPVATIAACTTEENIARDSRHTIVNCVVDVFTDILIIIFPLTIVWRVRISLYKKMVLACLFSMVLFTVAITLIRATTPLGRVTPDNAPSQNIGWVWFWFSIELDTSFFISCMASFRSLFVQIDNPRVAGPFLNQEHVSTRPSRPKRWLQDTLLNTILNLEGGTHPDREEYSLNSDAPSRRMSVGHTQHDGRNPTPSRFETNRTQSIEDQAYPQP
ncbi:hypothetical protein PG995_012563 [Apiospora arundinis]